MSTALLQTLKQDAIVEYENLVWAIAEAPDDPSRASGAGAVLHAAEKSLEQFAKDIEAIKKRIATQGDIEKYEQAQADIAQIAESRAGVEAEKARAMSEFDKQLTEIDAKANEASARKQAVRPAVKHYRASAPAWLREELHRTADRLIKARSRSNSFHLPPKPRNPLDTMQLLVNDEYQQSERKRLEESHERKLANYAAKSASFEADKADLLAREEQLAQRQAALQKASLLLRPRPEDVEAAK